MKTLTKHPDLSPKPPAKAVAPSRSRSMKESPSFDSEAVGRLLLERVIEPDTNAMPVQTSMAAKAGYADLVATARGNTASHDTTGMSAPLRASMESAFDADFSDVRVHKESRRATELGALSYTQGNEIYMAPGQWSPGTSQGKALLGHELAHVMQQREGRVQATGAVNGVALNDSPALEAEADTMGARAAQTSATSSAGRIQRKKKTNSSRVTQAKGGLFSWLRKLVGGRRGKRKKEQAAPMVEAPRDATMEEKYKYLDEYHPVQPPLPAGKDIESYDLASDRSVLLNIDRSRRQRELSGVHMLPEAPKDPAAYTEKRLEILKNIPSKQACDYISSAVLSYLREYPFKQVVRNYYSSAGAKEYLNHYFLVYTQGPQSGDEMRIVDPTYKQILAAEAGIQNLKNLPVIFYGTLEELGELITEKGGSTESARYVMDVYQGKKGKMAASAESSTAAPSKAPVPTPGPAPLSGAAKVQSDKALALMDRINKLSARFVGDANESVHWDADGNTIVPVPGQDRLRKATFYKQVTGADISTLQGIRRELQQDSAATAEQTRTLQKIDEKVTADEKDMPAMLARFRAENPGVEIVRD